MAYVPKYKIKDYIVSIHEHDQVAIFDVRRNGKAFYIEISPAYFVNSPSTLQKYLSHLELLRSGDEVLGDVYDTDVYEWVMSPYLQLLEDLAPPFSGDPSKIKMSLRDSLLPDYFFFHSYVVDEQLSPRRIVTDRRPLGAGGAYLQRDILDELEQWTTFYDPVRIFLSFENPEDALYKEPRKVLIKKETIECFYKPCHSAVQTIRELKTYKAIADAGLYSQGLNFGRVYGVVLDDRGMVPGILLTYIDCRNVPLSCRIDPEDPDNPPQELRRMWMQQIDDGITALHEADIVWGDVKSDNVLIDKDNNAWITDFGGGYTEGWVDKEVADTVKGDLMGIAKIRKLLFPSKG